MDVCITGGINTAGKCSMSLCVEGRRNRCVALKLNQKKAVVTEVNQIASEAVSAVVANYRGMSVSGLTEMRRRAIEMNVRVRVVRNTLAKRAFKETSLACLDEALTGPVILLFAMDHPGAAARLAKEFVKKYNMLEVTAMAFNEQLLPASELSQLAALPTYDEAIAQLMAMLKAPISRVATATKETVAKLVRVTSAVADKQQAA